MRRPVALRGALLPRIYLAFSAVWFVGCGGGADAPADSGGVADAAALPGLTPGSLQLVQLSESDVEHFIAASKDLQRLGIRAQRNLGNDPSSTERWAIGLQTNAEALGILRRHTFDLPRFQQVAYSVMMAFAAEDIQKAAGADEMAARLEEMKSKIPPEQYEQMKQMTAAASASITAAKNQPEGNVALVARYRDQITAVSEAK
jgi:hypothetical protein